jgi:hypothetical protein
MFLITNFPDVLMLMQLMMMEEEDVLIITVFNITVRKEFPSFQENKKQLLLERHLSMLKLY